MKTVDHLDGRLLKYTEEENGDNKEEQQDDKGGECGQRHKGLQVERASPTCSLADCGDRQAP